MLRPYLLVLFYKKRAYDREEYDEHEYGYVSDEERYFAFYDSAHIQLGDRCRREDVYRYRRRHRAYDVGYADDHAEVDDVDTESFSQRPENGNHQYACSDAFEEGAEDEQHYGYHYAEQRRAEIHRFDGSYEIAGDAGVSEYPGECCRRSDDEQDHRRAFC